MTWECCIMRYHHVVHCEIVRSEARVTHVLVSDCIWVQCREYMYMKYSMALWSLVLFVGQEALASGSANNASSLLSVAPWKGRALPHCIR